MDTEEDEESRGLLLAKHDSSACRRQGELNASK